ncbi:hypothetical protein Tco_0452199 [Tanacetum coccineum]
MNMALVLLAKAFKLNYSTPTNNNQRISSNPQNRQIAQPGMNLGQDNQNVGNQNGLIVVLRITNQNGNGNVVAARAEGNANGNNVRQRRIDATYLQTQLLIAQKGDSRNPIQVGRIFNMLTQEEQYTELLEPIPEPHQVPHNDSNVISKVSSIEQGGGIVEQHLATVKETRGYQESLFHNLVAEVDKVNTVNCKMKETNVGVALSWLDKNQGKVF